MHRVHINVLLPRNRDQKGVMEVVKEGQRIASFQVLGRGSAGQGDTSLFTNGNTPTGSYSANTFVKTDTKSHPSTSYGTNGALRLTPVGGNALFTGTYRDGLMIHGGPLAEHGPWKNSLKPTHGCLRLSNLDMQELLRVLREANLNPASSNIPDALPAITIKVIEF